MGSSPPYPVRVFICDARKRVSPPGGDLLTSNARREPAGANVVRRCATLRAGSLATLFDRGARHSPFGQVELSVPGRTWLQLGASALHSTTGDQIGRPLSSARFR